MEFKSIKVRELNFLHCSSSLILFQSGSKRTLFDAGREGENVAPKYVPDIEEQNPYESRR